MDIGTRIKKRREELKMSQELLAQKLGYKSRSSINKIELGLNDISQSKIIDFAKALRTTPAYLMGWDDYMDKDDAEFVKSLGTLHSKEDLPPEIEALNILLCSHGLQIMKTHGEYYLDEAGQLTEEELNDFLFTVTTMVSSAADVLIKKKRNELFK